MVEKWFRLTCKREHLQLLGTLNGGQSFRWKFKEDDRSWIGVFSRHVWVLKQADDGISYQVYGSENGEEFYNNLLSDYFQLKLDLEQHFSEWSLKDPIFKEAANQFYGIRILKQDLVENIFSFICSSNNNISRITGMVEKLALLCGDKICEIDGCAYHAFPSVESLAKDNIENILKKEGFGYRAKYISESAKLIVKEGGNLWLDTLKKLPYEESKIKLMVLTGIGPKVADCICLMSLGHLQSIPVDTHVYQIARKFYMPNLPKRKTVTAKIYKEIGDYFRELYGPLAGWAHTVLFCADLKKFQNDENKQLT
ncbi:N-glycosylase/DNA lyase [Asbolus verrucosus]|uniref:N-glycosylase/DNA lyase n=1 Tax=Asbolus verrucosus TaxID=1661398 RepID=A0A482W508_ASBVE|nr:N-glycosylase/DNA lyase [Asbolus verrucosus]